MTTKILKILILILIIFTSGAINAQAAISCRVTATCDSSEVVILELSGTTNAHAASPGSGYPYTVCCSGVSGLSSSCSGGQVFAKLSSAKNAHVRLNTESDYPGSNNACLSVPKGTLTLGNQDNDCSGFDTTILSLAKIPTNSQVGEGSVYPHKICAKYKAPSSGGGSGWLPNLFGGGGGSSSNDNSEVSIIINNQPTPIISIPQVSFDLPIIRSVSIPETSSASPADQVSVNNQNNEEPLAVAAAPLPVNLQAAAADSVGSKILDKPGSALVGFGALLGLILVARSLYFKRKAA